jgi:hypothetical protein
MVLDKGPAQRQAEAGALTDRLGREEGLEDPLLELGRNARAVVGDLDPHSSLDRVEGGAHGEAAVAHAAHGVLGVGNEVHQHLVELVRVGPRLRQVRSRSSSTSTPSVRSSYASSSSASRATALHYLAVIYLIYIETMGEMWADRARSSTMSRSRATSIGLVR